MFKDLKWLQFVLEIPKKFHTLFLSFQENQLFFFFIFCLTVIFFIDFAP